MNRRRLLVGLGGTCLAGGSVVGSGAFSSTDAQREMNVNVSIDDNAYLRLKAINTNFAYTDQNGLLEFKFDDDFAGTGDFGKGLSSDSIYEFSSLFMVQNQGTEPVSVFGLYENDTVSDIHLFESAPNPDPEPLTEDNKSTTLKPGGKPLEVGLRIDTTDSPIEEHKTSIKIKAASTDSHIYD